MRRSLKAANPFYVLLIIVGLSFALTATAYVVMAFREARSREDAIEANSVVAASDENQLMICMRKHGDSALLIELGVLAVCTFAAIGTDSYWQSR